MVYPACAGGLGSRSPFPRVSRLRGGGMKDKLRELAEIHKICSKCRSSKPLSQFVKDRRKPSGHASKCLDCKRVSDREFARTYYEINRDDELQRSKEYRGSHPGYAKIYYEVKKGTQKQLARTALQLAVRQGHIDKPKSCQECGTRCNPHGHHEDYTKPLSVMWLCTKCHGMKHRIKESA